MRQTGKVYRLVDEALEDQINEVLVGDKGMAGNHFQIQELNPFLEWHLHTTATSLEIASKEAKRIARMIGRKTRVLCEDGSVLIEVGP